MSVHNEQHLLKRMVKGEDVSKIEKLRY